MLILTLGTQTWQIFGPILEAYSWTLFWKLFRPELCNRTHFSRYDWIAPCLSGIIFSHVTFENYWIYSFHGDPCPGFTNGVLQWNFSKNPENQESSEQKQFWKIPLVPFFTNSTKLMLVTLLDLKINTRFARIYFEIQQKAFLKYFRNIYILII